MRDLLCVGNSVADAVARPVKAAPKFGQLQFVGTIGLYAGGCGLNTAVAASRLGLKAGVVTAVGADGFGDFLRRRLKEEKVDLSGILTGTRLHSSATLVSVAADGERAFLHTVGASALLNDRAIPDSLLKRYRYLHLSSYYLLPNLDGAPAARLLKRALALGLKTSLDTSWDPRGRWGLVMPCLPQTDFFMPSLSEACRIFRQKRPEALARAGFQAGVRQWVILKMGASGCQAFHKDGSSFRVGAVRVKAVDATGAGDSFDAGFLAGLAKGLGPLESLKIGAATGAASVAGPGAAGTIRNFSQIRKMAGTI